MYLFKFIVLVQPFGYERPIPHLILTDNIHSDTQAEPRKLSSLTLYIDLWQEGKPAPGQNPPVISPPVAIFRDSNPEPCAIQHKASQDGTAKPSPPTNRGGGRESIHLDFCLSTKRSTQHRGNMGKGAI
jgi:hypothetical protein